MWGRRRPKTAAVSLGVVVSFVAVAGWTAWRIRPIFGANWVLVATVVLACWGVVITAVGRAIRSVDSGSTNVRVGVFGAGFAAAAIGGLFFALGVRSEGLRTGLPLGATGLLFVVVGAYRLVASAAGVVERDRLSGAGEPITLYGLEVVARRLAAIGYLWFVLLLFRWLLLGAVSAVLPAGSLDYATLALIADAGIGILAPVVAVEIALNGDGWETRYSPERVGHLFD
ncbi:hypothetical protein I7X12_02085 [Halosimplex litoreum]|uniref:Uncharacterized protein n=1 Tax=Halosimplex litoreum TaxID=1198301 RepID=A0A7T3KVM4_9EURY|nr:hypothetical protein [Halosimplex litoreum]QPV63447.1 hypothetical protein I7X12_02085 [Halosimplex litoreum]